MAENEDIWVPPTDSEIKVLQAKRERSEKISKIMAEYLLKGYKMLSTCCAQCETVLLQDRQCKIYCVACSEVDNEHAKDDPALSGIAAQRQIQESQFSTSTDDTIRNLLPQVPSQLSRPANSSGDCVAMITSTNESVVGPSAHSSRSIIEIHSSEGGVLTCIRAVQDKMLTASKKLSKSNSPESSLQWCNVLKVCAETLITLKQIHAAENTRNNQ